MASMYLALGYRCNHHCLFCPCGLNAVKTDAASTERLIEAINQGIQEQGIDHITVSGGEPTLHPGFNTIIRHCIEKGLTVSILSNGDSFGNIERCRMLFERVDLRHISVITAVHSDLQELFEAVTRVPGSYKRTIVGISNLMRIGISVTVKQVISHWNYKRLDSFIDFVYRQYGPSVSLTLCGMDFCGMKDNSIEEVAVGYKELGPHLEKALDMVVELRERFGAFPEVTVADLPLCCVDPAYWGFFTNVSRGSITRYSAPGKDGKTVSTLSNVVSDCDVFANECRGCVVEASCPGIWKTAYDYFGNQEFSRIHPVL